MMWLRALKWIAVMSFTCSAKAEDYPGSIGTPSLELLEYLGEMVEDNGELIGPADLDEDRANEPPITLGDEGDDTSTEEVLYRD